MEDFFKQFRENLENRPEPKFEERDWKDMDSLLGREGFKPATFFAWWWLALPFLLLLTGSNAFFFWQWKKAEQKFSSSEIRRDTVFHTRVIHTTDTVYLTRVLRDRVFEYQNSYAQAGFSGGQKMEMGKGFSSALPGQPLENNNPSHSGSVENTLANTLPKPEGIPKSERLAQNTGLLPIGRIKPLLHRRSAVNLNGCEVHVPAKKHRKSFSDHLYAARPKGYQLGVSGGLAYPYDRGVDFKSGYSAGLHGALEFSPSLRLWADAAYFKTLFLTDRMGEDIGVPIVDPPSTEYIFLQAEVPQPFVQYVVGMQYLFRSKHQIKPFIGLGLGAISLLTYDVVYEFENTTLGVEWNFDKPIHRRGLVSNFLVLPLGLEFGFSKHWNGQIQATYRYNWQGTGVQSPDMLGIQGGLNYRF